MTTGKWVGTVLVVALLVGVAAWWARPLSTGMAGPSNEFIGATITLSQGQSGCGLEHAVVPDPITVSLGNPRVTWALVNTCHSPAKVWLGKWKKNENGNETPKDPTEPGSGKEVSIDPGQAIPSAFRAVIKASAETGTYKYSVFAQIGGQTIELDPGLIIHP